MTKTPREICEELTKLAAEIGPRAYVNASIASNREEGERPIFLSVYTEGILDSSSRISYHGTDFDELIAEVRLDLKSKITILEAKRIREIALAIIEVTAENGGCTVSDLRMRFDTSILNRLSKEACSEANRMSGLGPFYIDDLPNSNDV